ncbi:leucine-rich repeat and coiled-coil domain-containing protein 1 isoform X1 [Alligator mississippiensis]|uniref:Leucine-rich repeat and coiled-coil domain-containing protein 1 n=1 Tax=Alligator mississippiensis TaxID=8496 RepID=A0A151PHB1_ALLMI|nr:leucine-rich repeat and coiled-coil domain-containing protein 1 isoform X1 [Alligator mississippiensis]KYO48342.1 leucine-rich repeat and coiled-coil domain-containing protein 1 isoform B [Alligator mississippiensis]
MAARSSLRAQPRSGVPVRFTAARRSDRHSSLLELSLNSELHTINLHCNQISKIEGLGCLWNLQYLDLSSNQISKIEGLSALTNLRTLNLSCNLITKVEGLDKLFNLTKLNLSYNRIRDLGGFLYLRGTSHKISHIDLHSNCISNINHLLQCMVGLNYLTSLTLEKNGKNNPICDITGYREIILQTLPQLTVLDGRNIFGEPVNVIEEHSDLQCLEGLLDCLASSSSPLNDNQNCIDLPVITPHIDQVLARFWQRGNMAMQSTCSSSTEPVSSEPGRAKLDSIPSEIRIRKLEDQISQLLQKVSHSSSSGAPLVVLKAKRDTDLTSESECEIGKENNRNVAKRSKIPTYRKVNLSSKNHANNLKGKITARGEKSFLKSKHPNSQTEEDSHANSASETPDLEVIGKSARMLMGGQDQIKKVEDANPSATEESTYRALVQELDQEKERRWKAEQAEKKLRDYVKELQKQAKEEKNVQSIAVHTTDRLKELMLRERSTKTKLQADVQQLKDELERLTNELNLARNKEQQQQKALQTLEETLSKVETQRVQHQATEMKRIQEIELKASANEREVQLLRIALRQQKEKVQQLHELLSLREQEHRKELESRVALNGPEFQDVLSKQMAKEEKRHEQHVKEFQEKMNVLNQQYMELENEFRLALTIEAKRFKEVKESFENVAAELAEYKQVLFQSQQKEKQSATLIQELTSMVKEQKARITEVVQSKQEIAGKLKNRIQTLETLAEGDKHKSVQIELLKQEKSKLISQLTAQESVIDGLRMERKVWGQELAHQGASLAQDRGKLEAKIEVLTNEIEGLRKKNERDSDTLKIKTKIIEDQTETIRKLKERLQERDEQIRTQRQENAEIQKTFQVQLDERAAQLEELLEKLDRQNERKEELNQLLEEKEVELEDVRKMYSTMNKKWQDKGELLSQLEMQVKQMKENFDIKEKKLIEERNKSLQTQKVAMEKLRSMDDAFRRQLESTLAVHQAELARLANENQRQIEAANEKVYQVEEEMRHLLQETANNKKSMEEKIRRLTSALSDIQQGL